MALNQQYAKRGSMLANVYGKLVEEALDYDRALTEVYNTLGGDLNGKDKWYRMMVSAPGNGEKIAGLKAHAHMAYNSWNHESSSKIVPTYVQGVVGSQLIVDVTGDEAGYSGGTVALPNFYNVNNTEIIRLNSTDNIIISGNNFSLISENYSLKNNFSSIRIDGNCQNIEIV